MPVLSLAFFVGDHFKLVFSHVELPEYQETGNLYKTVRLAKL